MVLNEVFRVAFALATGIYVAFLLRSTELFKIIDTSASGKLFKAHLAPPPGPTRLSDPSLRRALPILTCQNISSMIATADKPARPLLSHPLSLPPPPPSHTTGFICHNLAREWVQGAEDLTHIGNGVWLAGVDDRLRLWEHPAFGPEKTPDGDIIAVYSQDTDDIRVSGWSRCHTCTQED